MNIETIGSSRKEESKFPTRCKFFLILDHNAMTQHGAAVFEEFVSINM